MSPADHHVAFVGAPIIRHKAWALAGAVLIVAAAWLTRDRGGMLLLGLLAGVLAAAGIALALAVLRPVGALIEALRPLGVPLLLIIAAGTIESPLLLQLGAGAAAMLIAWHILVKPERTDILAWFRNARHRRIGLGLLAAFALLALWSPGTTLDARGGAAAYFFALAILLLALAAFLRISGYAETLLKVPIAALLVLAGVRVAMESGLLWGDKWLDEHVSWLTPELLLIVAGLALAVSIAFEVAVWSRSQHTAAQEDLEFAIPLVRPLLPSWTHGAWMLGTSAAVVAALALFAAMVVAANPGTATGKLAGDIHPVAPTNADDRPADLGDDALARAYSPVLLFSDRERWSPVPVEDFIKDAGASLTVTNWEGTPLDPADVHNLTDCPGTVTPPCYQLTIGCEDGGADCAQGRDATDGERRQDGAVYVRVVRKHEPRSDRSPDPFEDVRGFPGTSILVQYWFFYPYDDWRSPVLAGQLRQHHEADWEAVTIGFSDEAPQFVGFSQHCGGQWYAWRDVRVDGKGQHVLVAVADGSQANYRYPNPSEAPDWTGCANLPARTLTLLSYASNIRDRTGADWSWEPGKYVPVDGSTWPTNFLGRWAPFSRTEIQTPYRDTKLGADAPGPATPTLQRLWQEPMRTIFRGAQWHRGKTTD